MTNTAPIEGYAAIFNERDLNGDVILPGAFAKSLKNRTSPVRMLYSHAPETPIGRWMSLKEDRKGLFATGEILLGSPKAREVHALIEGGAIDGLSIGYQTVRSKKGTRSGRTIIEAELWEVSVVTFPMAPGARVTFVGAQISEDFLLSNRNGALPPGAPPAQRTLATPTSVRCFSDALRSAASILLV